MKLQQGAEILVIIVSFFIVVALVSLLEVLLTGE